MEPPSLTYNALLFDELASAKRPFLVSFWASDSSVSLYDVVRHRAFMRRCLPQEDIRVEQLRPGVTLQVSGRRLTLGSLVESSKTGEAPCSPSTAAATVLVVLPSCTQSVGRVLTLLEQQRGANIGRIRMVTEDEANQRTAGSGSWGIYIELTGPEAAVQAAVKAARCVFEEAYSAAACVNTNDIYLYVRLRRPLHSLISSLLQCRFRAPSGDSVAPLPRRRV